MKDHFTLCLTRTRQIFYIMENYHKYYYHILE